MLNAEEVSPGSMVNSVGSETNHRTHPSAQSCHVPMHLGLLVSCIPNGLQFVAPKMPQGEVQEGTGGRPPAPSDVPVEAPNALHRLPCRS